MQEVAGLFMRSGKLYQLYTCYFSIIFGGPVLKFSDKTDLTVQMKIFSNVKHRNTVCLKSGDRFFTFLTKLRWEAKASICSAIKKNLILYSHKFSVFVVAVISYKSLSLQESLVSILNDAHSIWDIKLPWLIVPFLAWYNKRSSTKEVYAWVLTFWLNYKWLVFLHQKVWSL